MAYTVPYVYLTNDSRKDIVIVLFEMLIMESMTNFQYMFKAWFIFENGLNSFIFAKGEMWWALGKACKNNLMKRKWNWRYS